MTSSHHVRDDGIYSVVLTVPGDAAWCLDLVENAREWIDKAGPPLYVDDPRMLPAVEATRHDPGVPVVEFRWIEIPADGAWDAMAKAVATIEIAYPQVVRSPFLTVDAELQDPDAERRRPEGA